jgi:hypothetical protein
MTWPSYTHFGIGRDPRAAGKKGGASRPKGRKKSREWLRGYQAGWKARDREERMEKA